MKRLKYQLFIIHEFSTGNSIAHKLKAGLARFDITTFVAPQDLLPGDDEELIRLSALKDAKEILLIVTYGLMQRPGEVVNELRIAIDEGKEERIRPYRKSGITPKQAVECLRHLGIRSNKQCPEFEDISDIIEDILRHKSRGEYFHAG